VAVNCSAIPENLLESELFGHERGAFTDARTRKRGLLEVAEAGTVLLDEIDELPTGLQPKLLRVLEERRVRRLGGVDEYDVACRVVAATNVSLHRSVDEGAFREDLYYRLNVFRIELPPLRDRPGDLARLANYFMRTLCRDQGIEPKRFSPEALAVLRSHDWPGNVRELKNLIESTLIVCDGPVVQASHVQLQRRWVGPASDEEEEGSHRPALQVPPEGLTLEEAERELVRQTLAHADGNRSKAARMLGVSRPTVIRKIRKYGLGES
jgi:DNA-binding NtrC family response regulator